MTSDEHMQQWLLRCREDGRSNAELLGQAESRLADPEDEVYWEAVRLLHGRFCEEIRAQVDILSCHADAGHRRLAADILSQCHLGDPSFEEAAGRVLMRMAARESDPNALNSIAAALGHNNHPARATVLAPLAEHPNAEVRWGVAYGLAGDSTPESITALIELSQDSDTDVRDWATFALGSQTELDTPELREALWDRVDDADDETRGEAIIGLAHRKEARMIAVIERELARPEVGRLVVEAAKEFPHRGFLPGLNRLNREEWDLDLLQEAIAACELASTAA